MGESAGSMDQWDNPTVNGGFYPGKMGFSMGFQWVVNGHLGLTEGIQEGEVCLRCLLLIQVLLLMGG